MLLSTTIILPLLQAWLVSGAGAVLTDTTLSVQLDQATVIGTSSGPVESFLGIPYAQPPVGDLRLQLPQLIDSYNGTLNATTLGNQCIQQAFVAPPGLPPEVIQDITPFLGMFSVNPNVTQSEDCLNINVIRPANTSVDAKLPVLFWIYGGGFTTGSNAILAYNGTAIVERSIELDEPVIYVALNYRLHVFGFLGGQEIKDAGVGNLGLQDQRAAMRWVNKFISSFGGDPSKVTIWGESAGSISTFLHLFANGGDAEGLFRAGIMSSGSSVPTGDITEVQGTYDFVVDEVGCSGANDTLACLRTVSTDSLLAAANNTPSFIGFQGLATPYMPRADGVFVTLPPGQLSLKAEMADVPFIIGDVKDEGTLFSLGSFNITAGGEFAAYISENWFPGSSLADLNKTLALYPSDPAAGSPFDTGDANVFTPEYKHIAAVQGDWFFQGPRRQFLDAFSADRTTFNFLSARGNFSGVGDAHTTDLLNVFAPGDMTDFFVRFVHDLDPNGNCGVQWPPYNTSARATLQFNDGDVPLNITVDDQRLNGTDELTSLSLRFPF
ncbi:carotenoid ester lipase precursor [Lentinus tigrinus ALCF2SS1-7]|uniref:Carboxylic ester hydrolase n=1 Tax=Lentinus tigrinus ALCF2SS1-6 TaxID=1328759 RepID=A0A5C2S593_9APHY|nr:carotenoid ester lipase precursor [Lentinus tigrinus ALCF2SS1-6]RPD68927.1 carotenoid ester lipase precursor [Lentinus tigrinus ALCF2SS1-7]